jgi:hypothetical protein
MQADTATSLFPFAGTDLVTPAPDGHSESDHYR